MGEVNITYSLAYSFTLYAFLIGAAVMPLTDGHMEQDYVQIVTNFNQSLILRIIEIICFWVDASKWYLNSLWWQDIFLIQTWSFRGGKQINSFISCLNCHLHNIQLSCSKVLSSYHYPHNNHHIMMPLLLMMMAIAVLSINVQGIIEVGVVYGSVGKASEHVIGRSFVQTLRSAQSFYHWALEQDP